MTAPVSVPRRREGQLVPKLVAIIGIVAVAALLYMAASWLTSFIDWLFAGPSSASPITLVLQPIRGLLAAA